MSKLKSRICVLTYRNDYTGTAVDGTTPLQISASLGIDVSEIEIFDSSGQVMEFLVGPASSEVRQFFIMPGGNTQRVQALLNKGMRLSVRAITATANTGQLVINFYQ